jgi:hypothetical protein
MKKFLIVLSTLSLIVLSGCQGARFGDFIATAGNAITATENAVTPQQIYIAANAFDAVKVSAINYLELKRCPTNAPFCRDPSVTKKLIPLIRAGTIARNNAVTWARANPNGFADVSLYNKLTAITSTIEEMMRQYNIGG